MPERGHSSDAHDADVPVPRGLIYVSDTAPGISRRRRGRHFVYHRPDGSRFDDSARVQRIRSLAIPPAYTQAWTCQLARGRKQYRYHADWCKARDAHNDPRVARVVRRCRALPGRALFRYHDENGAPHAIDSGDVNDYLRRACGADDTAKDFRTWHASVHALALAAELGAQQVLAAVAQRTRGLSADERAFVAFLAPAASTPRTGRRT